MRFEGNDITVNATAEEQPDELLVKGSHARERGLKLPLIGAVAAQSAIRNTEASQDTTGWLKAQELANEKLPSAHQGYTDVLDALNEGCKSKSRVEVRDLKELKAEFKTWFTPERLAAYQAINPNIPYDIIATPNIEIGRKDIYKVAKAFGKDQPHETSIYDGFYDKYTDEELAGTHPANCNKFMFSLVPREYTPGVEGTVEEQKDIFKELHDKHPDAKVLSVFEAITRWYTLRAQGEKLTDENTFDLTHIRHFNLPKKRVGFFWPCVPRLCVDDRGEPVLDDSEAGDDDSTRISVE